MDIHIHCIYTYIYTCVSTDGADDVKRNDLVCICFNPPGATIPTGYYKTPRYIRHHIHSDRDLFLCAVCMSHQYLFIINSKCDVTTVWQQATLTLDSSSKGYCSVYIAVVFLC